jgi:uracil phosphoribosyltransferase
MERIALRAAELEGRLSAADLAAVAEMNRSFAAANPSFLALEASANESGSPERSAAAKRDLIELYGKMGRRLQEILSGEDRLWVYPFRTASDRHAEASRLIAKLRDRSTGKDEFVYYTQRAYELLFGLAFGQGGERGKNHLIVRTPVSVPAPAFAVHKIPDIDEEVSRSVMCVLLRGALLPSIIVSKEIEEYSSSRYVTPFALFRIKRRDGRRESEMEYLLDPDRSYFDPAALSGKDLIFADPMNATGGSLVAVLSYLAGLGVKPRSVIFMNVIASLKGALMCVRSAPSLRVYTLWMDPALNDLAYILPGLGDAGDRLNGRDADEEPRDILRLIADYGSNVLGLYRSQIKMIEKTVLGRPKAP